MNRIKGKRTGIGVRGAMAALWWLCMCVFVACTADELPAPEDGTGGLPSVPGGTGIYVSGGRDDVSLSTGKRYVDPNDAASGPQIEGVCLADRVDVFMYTVETGYSDLQAPDGLSEFTYTQTWPYDLSVKGYDRYAPADFTSEKESAVEYIYAAALAYSQADEGSFTVMPGQNATNPSLGLQGKLTPELFYGTVLPDEASSSSTHDDEEAQVYDKIEDTFWWGLRLSRHTTLTSKFKGRIFRIVSQINVEVADVEKALVESMELRTDNYPQQITLYGSHGTNYPVAACTDAVHTSGATTVALDNVSFAEGDTLGTTTVRLSSFFLPSEVGMHLQLHIKYRKQLLDSEGHYYTEKTYNLRPARSYYLSGADAAVYQVGDGLKNGSNLYVYDGRDQHYCFYSYSNVRVNLSGPFANFAVNTDEADITIEVEPNFEKEHHYVIDNS